MEVLVPNAHTSQKPIKIIHPDIANEDNVMISNRKTIVSTSLLVFSVGIISLRFQRPLPVLSVIFFLGLASLTIDDRTPILLLLLFLTVLFPGFNFNRLYGRDTHFVAAHAVKIQNNGWPLPKEEILPLGFPSTPMIHIEAIAVSQVTGVPIFPSTNSRIIVTSILPLIFFIILFIFAYNISRQGTVQSTNRNLLLLPLLAFIPTVEFYTGFRRETLGFLFFGLVVYVIYRVINNPDKRLLTIAIFISILMPLTHHLSSFVLTLFLFSSLIVIYLHNSRNAARSISNNIQIILVIQIISITTLYFISELGGQFLLQVIIGAAAVRLNNIVTYIGGYNTQSAPFSEFMVSRTTFDILRYFLSRWIYQLIVGIGITSITITCWLETERTDVVVNIVFLFSVFIGLGSVVSYLTGVVSYSRLFSFFLLSSAWLAPIGGREILDKVDLNKKTKKSILNMSIVFLLMLGVINIPAYTISNSPPDYTTGEMSQRFNEATYSSASHVDNHLTTKIVTGDATVREIIGSRGYSVIGSHSVILSGKIPSGNHVILGHWNEQIYRAVNYRYDRRIIINTPPETIKKFDTNNTRHYDNGDIIMYQG